MQTYFTSNHFFHKRAFTLVELLVVMAIATVIMTSLILQQNKWNDQLIASSQAYEMALMIRQAQIYSLGVREFAGGTGDKFDMAYGIAVASSFMQNGKLESYKFFVDKDRDGRYDANETIEEKTLQRGAVIEKFCGYKATGSLDEKCYPGAGNIDSIHITFLRPSPRAVIGILNGGSQNSHNIVPPATFYIKSPGGKYYNVKVEANGQISVAPGGPS